MAGLPVSVAAISDSESELESEPPGLIDEDSDVPVPVRWSGETGGATQHRGKGSNNGNVHVPAASQSNGKGSRPGNNDGSRSADFIEVFSGGATLSRAVMNHGMRVMSWDLRNGSQFDMSQDEAVQDLTHRAVMSGAQYVHFAPPCNTYSPARWPRIRSITWFSR